MMNDMEKFLEDLSSASPVPGGGGASALVGSLSAALCAMVTNLTTGKKKYAMYQQDYDRILPEVIKKQKCLYEYIQKDAMAFEPLSRAYGIPKDQPDRDQILEKALYDAAATPLALLEELSNLTGILEELADKGSRLALSDVGVAAAFARAALEGTIMNVYINTKLMKQREKAEEMNQKAIMLLNDGVKRCEAVYQKIVEELCRN